MWMTSSLGGELAVLGHDRDLACRCRPARRRYRSRRSGRPTAGRGPELAHLAAARMALAGDLGAGHRLLERARRAIVSPATSGTYDAAPVALSTRSNAAQLVHASARG